MSLADWRAEIVGALSAIVSGLFVHLKYKRQASTDQLSEAQNSVGVTYVRSLENELAKARKVSADLTLHAHRCQAECAVLHAKLLHLRSDMRLQRKLVSMYPDLAEYFVSEPAPLDEHPDPAQAYPDSQPRKEP